MISISNKKYAVVKQNALNNKDIIITENGNYYAEEPYSGLGTVRVRIPEPIYEEITLNPTIYSQEILPSENINGISKVILNPVTSDIDENIKAENIAKGINILGIEGSLEFIKEDIIINPSINTQILNPTNDGFNQITVNPVTAEIDENINSNNIKKGINILGVEGSLVPVNNTTRDINANGLYRPSHAYTGFSEVNVQVQVENEELNITPTTNVQIFENDDPLKGFSPVKVEAVTSDIDSNIISSNIRKGVEILGVIGDVEVLNTKSIEITDNGTFIPEQPYNGFSQVTVNVNKVNNKDININSNGTYIAEEPYSGFGTVIVDIDTVNNIPLNITANNEIQTFVPEAPYTGFSTVTVAANKLQSKTFIFDENTPTIFTIQPDDEYNGMDSITIDLSWIENQLNDLNAGDVDTNILNLQEITVSNSGEYTYDNGYDGIGKVTVDLSWVDSAIEAASQGNCNGDADSLIDNSVTEIATDALLIRDYAFYHNEQLEKIILNLAMSIGEYAFSHTNLNTLIINSPSFCTLENINAFTTVPNIYVKNELLYDYLNDEKWSHFQSNIFSLEDYTA